MTWLLASTGSAIWSFSLSKSYQPLFSLRMPRFLISSIMAFGLFHKVIWSFNKFEILFTSIYALGFLIILSRKVIHLVGFLLTLYGIWYDLEEMLILPIIYSSSMSYSMTLFYSLACHYKLSSYHGLPSALWNNTLRNLCFIWVSCRDTRPSFLQLWFPYLYLKGNQSYDSSGIVKLFMVLPCSLGISTPQAVDGL